MAASSRPLSRCWLLQPRTDRARGHVREGIQTIQTELVSELRRVDAEIEILVARRNETVVDLRRCRDALGGIGHRHFGSDGNWHAAARAPRAGEVVERRPSAGRGGQACGSDEQSELGLEGRLARRGIGEGARGRGMVYSRQTSKPRSGCVAYLTT